MVQNEANYAKKYENLDFRFFFEFECLNMFDDADYDSMIVLMVRSIFQVEETSSRESSNNDEDGDNDGEGQGITNHYVLFVG